MGCLVLVPLYVSITPGLTAPLVLESRCDRTIEIEAQTEDPEFVLEQPTLALEPGESGVLWIAYPVDARGPSPWPDLRVPARLILQSPEATPVRIGLFRHPVDDIPPIGEWEMGRPDGELLRVIRVPKLPGESPGSIVIAGAIGSSGPCGSTGNVPDGFRPVVRPIVSGTEGTLSLTGGDEARLLSTVRKYTGLQYCYEKVLKIDPTLEGRVEVAWGWKDGLVLGTPSVRGNTTENAELSDCVAKKIRRWEADPDVNGEVSWTFDFEQRPSIVRR